MACSNIMTHSIQLFNNSGIPQTFHDFAALLYDKIKIGVPTKYTATKFGADPATIQ
jgi:hypothetical protein